MCYWLQMSDNKNPKPSMGILEFTDKNLIIAAPTEVIQKLSEVNRRLYRNSRFKMVPDYKPPVIQLFYYQNTKEKHKLEELVLCALKEVDLKWSDSRWSYEKEPEVYHNPHCQNAVHLVSGVWDELVRFREIVYKSYPQEPKGRHQHPKDGTFRVVIAAGYSEVLGQPVPTPDPKKEIEKVSVSNDTLKPNALT